jgi:hypothetical protein
LSAQIREIVTGGKASLSKTTVGFNYIMRLISWNYHEGMLDSDKLFTRFLQFLQEAPVSKPEELCLTIYVLLEYLADMCKLSKSIVRQLMSICMEKVSQVSLVMLLFIVLS